MTRSRPPAMLRRHSLVLALALGLAGGAAFRATAGHAQDAIAAECAGLADPAAEIACLRNALDASRKALADAQGTPAPASQPSVSAQGAQAAGEGSQAAVLGGEQLPRTAVDTPAAASDPEQFTASIAASRTDPRGLLVVQLDNGQIWRQTDGTDLPVRIDGNERMRVEIARSGFGGYRMSFPDLGRRIAVSRLR